MESPPQAASPAPPVPSASPSVSGAEVEKEKAVAATTQMLQERKALRQGNLAPGPLRLQGAALRELKSDLKKATAFSKKVKGFTCEQLPSILQDLASLNVAMFVSEAAQSLSAVVAEGKLKTVDVAGFVQLCSVLHQKYDKFLPDFQAQLKKGWTLQPITEELETKFDILAPPADVAKVRGMVRVWCELWLVGLLPSYAFIDTALAKILSVLDAKPAHHLTPNALALLLLILKVAGPELLPGNTSVPAFASVTLPTEPQADVEAAASVATSLREADSNSVVYTKASDRPLLLKKFADITGKATELSTKLKKNVEGQWRTLCEATELRGEMSAEVKEKFGKVKGEVERFIGLANGLAGALRMPDCLVPPLDLSRALTKSSVDESIVFQSGLADFYQVKQVETVNRFDDAQQRAFYEQLLDIEELFTVPKASLQFTIGDGPRAPGAPTISVGEDEEDDDAKGKQKSYTRRHSAVDSRLVAEADFARLEGVMARFRSECAAKDYIDRWLAEFAHECQRLFLEAAPDAKAQAYFALAMGWLIDELRFPSPQSAELFPCCGRATATISKVFPEVGTTIAQKLEGEVVHLVKGSVQNAFQRKMRGVKYVAELVKFRAAPPIRLLRLMNLCLEDWENGQSVEMMIAMLESAGPYLMRGGVTKEKMTDIVEAVKEAMLRKGVRSNVEPLLETALTTTLNATKMTAQVCAPKIRIRSPLELYLRFLLFSELTERTFIDVRNKVRTFPWTDAAQGDLCGRILRKVHLISWDKVHLLAEIVCDVSSVHGWVGVNVSDAVLETLRLDLECPAHRSHQHRIQDLKYLGELFNFRLVTEEVLFYVMAQLVLYHPVPSPVTDYTPIRLVATLLETAGPYFLDPQYITAKSKVMLRALFSYFAVMVHHKARPLPLDLDYKLADVVAQVKAALAPSTVPKARGRAALAPEKEYQFPETRQAAEADLEETQRVLVKHAEAGFQGESWLLDLFGCLTGGKDRIYSVAQRLAPVGMDTTQGSHTAGPRAKPIESHRDDESDGSSGDEDEGSGSEDSEGSDEAEEESDSDEEDEEEEEENPFERGTFTRGGDWGAARPVIGGDQTEEDRLFSELLIEAKREAVRGVRTSAAVVRQNIERTVEDRLPTNLAPYVRQTKGQQGGRQPAPSPAATSSSTEAAEASTPPTVTFAVLRRAGNDRVEAKSIHVPVESEFAQKTSQTQNAEERKRAEDALRVMQMVELQRQQEAKEAREGQQQRWGWGGRGRWR